MILSVCYYTLVNFKCPRDKWTSTPTQVPHFFCFCDDRVSYLSHATCDAIAQKINTGSDDRDNELPELHMPRNTFSGTGLYLIWCTACVPSWECWALSSVGCNMLELTVQSQSRHQLKAIIRWQIQRKSRCERVLNRSRLCSYRLSPAALSALAVARREADTRRHRALRVLCTWAGICIQCPMMFCDMCECFTRIGDAAE